MDIIITENQELNAKNKVIFFLLDKQKYNLVEIGDNIYFVKKIGDKKAEIRFDKSDGWCWISYSLISFLSSITGFERSEVQELTSNWVEHTLQMEVIYNSIPIMPICPSVEHTLQMEVIYNGSPWIIAGGGG
jgi:hypothetical protein